MRNNQQNNPLKKKGQTGAEVGKLLIASMLNDLQQQGKRDKEQLFSQDEFEILEMSLSSHKDIEQYATFRTLCEGVIDSYNRGEGMYQQFFNGYGRLRQELEEIYLADSIQETGDNAPIIVTDSQYQRLKDKAYNTLKAIPISYSQLIFYVMNDYSYTRKEQRIPENIQKAINATKNEPAANKPLCRTYYNKLMGNGYYMLPNGKRDDEMTPEEWHKAIREEECNAIIATMNGTLEWNGAPPSIDEVVNYNAISAIERTQELFFRGPGAIREILKNKTDKLDFTDAELMELVERALFFGGSDSYDSEEREVINALGFSAPLVKWHLYNDLPNNLSAYDLLIAILEGQKANKIDIKTLFKAFKADYAPLYKAIKEHLEAMMPKLKDIKPNQMHKALITLGDIVEATGDKDYIRVGKEHIIDAYVKEGEDDNDIRRRGRALHGFAILQDPSPLQVDRNGDYKDIKPVYKDFSLFALKDDPEHIARLQAYVRDLIQPALSFSYAFNALLSILGNVYDTPELNRAAHNTIYFEAAADAFNRSLFSLYKRPYGNVEEVKEKRAIIKSVFSPIQIEELRPSQAIIEEITAEITSSKFAIETRKRLKYLDGYINRLMSSRGGRLIDETRKKE